MNHHIIQVTLENPVVDILLIYIRLCIISIEGFARSVVSAYHFITNSSPPYANIY